MFVRYASEKSNCIREEFLMCRPLIATTKAIDVYNLIDEFFIENSIDWKTKIGQICCDGAPAMLGRKSGFADLVKRHSPQVEVVHCYMHRHALASKTLPTCLKNIFKITVRAINLISLN